MKAEETPTLPTLELLRRVPIFAGLSENQLILLSNNLLKEIYPKNHVLVHEGQLSDHMFIIISGRVKVQITNQEEKRDVILAVLGPGEFFGEMSLIDQHPASASVITLQTSHLIVVDKRDFRLHLLALPDVALNLMRGLAKHLRIADKK
jgi:CRP/FNR family cyclic AMP-dependent transcriptional regulator